MTDGATGKGVPTTFPVGSGPPPGFRSFGEDLLRLESEAGVRQQL